VDLSEYFGQAKAGFCMLDLKTGKTIRHNPVQCSTRFSPCSTFKIPNSLIGLETGVISDTSFVIPWDPVRNPKVAGQENRVPYKFWYQDLSLKNAFRYSSVWYYQELARRVGSDRMGKMVERLKYGNGDISGGVDSFWLCSSLQVSVDEQVDFIRRLYEERLEGFSERTVRLVKALMLVESGPGFMLSAKTGTGDCSPGSWIAWYVGFAETKSGPKIFAWNILLEDYASIQKINRADLTKKILKKLE
jgi:beta-lactamase class D